MNNSNKKFGVILSDPPWGFSNVGVNGSARKHYPTMTDRQILSLPIERWAKDDSILVLWCLNSKLDVGLEVIKAWGFKFVTKFPWIKFTGKVDKKPSWGTGFWARGCSEDILIAKRGNARPPQEQFLGLLSDRLEHSRKPDSIYTYCQAFPGPYLELFSRRIQPGWDAWGDGIQSTINLLEGLPSDYLTNSTVLALCRTIGTAWRNEEQSKWVIGDAVSQMIKSGIPPMQAYRMAASQMGSHTSIHWPLLMHKIALTFPLAERDGSAWHQYRLKYEQIRKIKHEKFRFHTQRVKRIRSRIDEFFLTRSARMERASTEVL